jgi:hypothetical protein
MGKRVPSFDDACGRHMGILSRYWLTGTLRSTGEPSIAS